MFMHRWLQLEDGAIIFKFDGYGVEEGENILEW